MLLMPVARSFWFVVVAQHVGQREGAVDDELGVVVEETEESPLARHETRDEVHCFSAGPTVSTRSVVGRGGAVTVTSTSGRLGHGQASISLKAFR